MKNLIFKILFVYHVIWALWNIGWIFPTEFFMHNTEEQDIYFRNIALIIWSIFTVISIITIIIRFRPSKIKLQNIKKQTKDELILLSEQIKTIALISVKIYIIIFLLSAGIYIGIALQSGINNLALESILLLIILGMVLLPMLLFKAMNFWVKRVHEKISKILIEEGLFIKKFPPKTLNSRFFASFNLIITFTFWFMGFSYYKIVDFIIDESSDSYQKFQENYVSNSKTSFNNVIDADSLISQIQDIKFVKQEYIFLADRTGEIIYKQPHTKIYVKKWKDINQRIKIGFKDLKTETFYENENGNILSYIPLNKKYILGFAVNIESKLISINTIYFRFLISFLVIILLAFSSAGLFPKFFFRKK